MPLNWPTSQLRDLADVRVSNVDKKSYAAERPIRLCNYMDVYANDYLTSALLDYMPATASPSEIERFALHAGDVVITKDSETPDDIGVPAVIVEDIDGLVCGYHLALIRPKASVHPIFLAKQLASGPTIRYFAANATGSTRFGLAIGTIEKLDVPTPPIAEQAKIAEVLSTVDRAIEGTEALIAKQQRIKTGLMQDLLTRGIDEHGDLRSEQTHEFKDSPLGRIPMEWEVITLGAMLKRARGYLQTGPFGSQLHAHEYVHEGTPVIMPQDILNGQISTSVIARIPERRANELHRHRLLPNDIVFSRRGDLSRAAGIGEREAGWICGTGCFLLRVSPDAIDSTWLANVYRHHHVQRQVETNAVGSTMPSLNNAVMENLIIAFPKADEQQEIMRRCDAAADGIASTFDQLAKMRALKRALMQDLLTGNRRVTPLLERREGVTT